MTRLARSVGAVLLVGLLAQAAVLWLQRHPIAVAINVSAPFPATITAVESDFGRVGTCRSYVLCTVGCRYCAALARQAERLPAEHRLNWLIAGSHQDALRFAELHNIPAKRVYAASLSRPFVDWVGVRYLSIPVTPLIIVLDAAAVVRRVDTDVSAQWYGETECS